MTLLLPDPACQELGDAPAEGLVHRGFKPSRASRYQEAGGYGSHGANDGVRDVGLRGPADAGHVAAARPGGVGCHRRAEQPGQATGRARAAARHAAGDAQRARPAAGPDPELHGADLVMTAPLALATIA